jgi:hypothetical protein
MATCSTTLFAWRVVLEQKTKGNPAHQRPQWSMEPLTLTPPLHPTTSAALAPSTGVADADQDVESLRIVEVEKASNKRKHTCMKNFGSNIKSTTGLDLLPAPDRNGRSASQCGTCLVADPTKLTFILNVRQKWNKHARSPWLEEVGSTHSFC